MKNVGLNYQKSIFSPIQIWEILVNCVGNTFWKQEREVSIDQIIKEELTAIKRILKGDEAEDIKRVEHRLFAFEL